VTSPTRHDSATVAPAFASAVVLSLLGAIFHNWREFGPAGLLAPATGTLPVVLIQLGVLVLWWKAPSARTAATVALGLLALLHFVGGGILSVLPWSALPFEPEQSLSHYASHIVYGIAQLPLLAMVAKRLLL
jgi:hypothetical protein